MWWMPEKRPRICCRPRNCVPSWYGRALTAPGALPPWAAGVVGDLAGFVASIYYRGIPFMQIPTTVVAQVDSSVGGKTAVNIPEGKNLAGAFHQPAVVVIDPTTLVTLDRRTLAEGLGGSRQARGHPGCFHAP